MDKFCPHQVKNVSNLPVGLLLRHIENTNSCVCIALQSRIVTSKPIVKIITN